MFNMKTALVVVFAAFASIATADLSEYVTASSSSSSTSAVTSASMPPSVDTEISDAVYRAANILTIGSIINTVELTTPSLYTAEDVIESYERDYPTMIAYMEEVYASPWIETSSTSFSSMTQDHSALASAISLLLSVEATHASLSAAQYTLQDVMYSQSSILSYLTEYTALAEPSVYYATGIVSYATLTSPSIVATVLEVYTAVTAYSSVADAISALSSEVYVLPSTLVEYIATFISSPSTVPPSIVSMLATCYPSVYAHISSVVSFTRSHSSVVSAITDYLYVAESVSSLGSAIGTILSYEEPTLTYQISIISSITSSWPSFRSDVSWLDDDVASSPTMYYKLGTMEESFYLSPSIAYSIYEAMAYPSKVTNPSLISYEKISHQSLVTAIDYMESWESANPSSASTMSAVLGYLTCVWTRERTILTAASYLSAATSPSTYSASEAVSTMQSVVSDLSSVMYSLSYVTDAVPSLSCEEASVEYYAYYYPSIIETLWDLYQSPSSVTSSFSYYSELTASYPSLAADFYSIEYYESSYSSLSSVEDSLISAFTSDSSMLSQWSAFSSASSSASSDISISA